MSRVRVVQVGTTDGRSGEIQVRRQFRDGNRVDAFLTEPDSFVTVPRADARAAGSAILAAVADA